MHSTRLIAFFALFVASLAQAVVAGDVFTPEHTAKLRMVSSAEISPDGRYVAYVLQVPRIPKDEASGSSLSELWVILPNGVSRPFVSGEVNVSAVAWKPDGSAISFLAKRGSDKNAVLWVIPVDGGEARKVLAPETGIASYDWSPDGKRIAYIATDDRDKERKKWVEKGFDAEIFEEEFRPTRVWVAALDDADAGADPVALELPGFPSDLSFSPSGDRLALALAPTPLVDDFYMKRRVHVVSADDGAVVVDFENPGKLGKIAWSPDGARVAFIAGQDENDPNEGSLMVGDVATSELRQLALGTEGDFDDIAWKDAQTITYLASIRTTSRAGEISADGAANKVRVADGDLVLSGLSLSADGKSAGMLVESAEHPYEVAVMSDGNSAPRRMTDSNPWLAGMRFAKQEIVRHAARDGLELEGILIRPLDEEPGLRYPLILSVHGGPEAHVDNGWQTTYSRPGQTAAARGFAVFSPNYRGSTGRGVEFSKLGQADYAGKEFDDLVDAVDHLIATGLVDGDKVGITGGSYGGFASAWGATYYSHRFAASVMFVGISNHLSKTGTTDIPNEMFLVHARKKLYGNWDWYLERSPIYHVEKSRTPLLILHGKDDTRVHPSQSMELYRHMKVLGNAPVRLVFYPGEGHGNRKSAGRYDYNLRMLRWFEHYLKGPGGEPPPHELELEFEPETENGKEPENE